MRKCVWRQPGLLHDAKYHAGRFIKSRDFYCSLNHVKSLFVKSRDFLEITIRLKDIRSTDFFFWEGSRFVRH